MTKQMKKEKKRSSIRILMITSYIFIALVAIGSVAFLTYVKTSNSMTNKVGKLTAATNDQIKLGINHQLDNIEDICSLVFSDSQTYQYDDTDDSISDYEKIQIKSEINDILLNNSLMNNFGDFCIVYSNNKSVGKLSSTTSEILGSDTIYNTAKGFISRNTTQDGWVAGYKDYYTKIFYVKQVNDNAVLLTSIYTADLDALMELSEEMQGMIINIVDKDHKVIFSTDEITGGTSIEEGLSKKINEKDHSAFIYENQLYTANTLNDDWHIVSHIATDTVLEEVYEVRDYTILIAAIGVVVAIIIGIVFAESITRPINRLVQMMKKAEQGDLTVKTDFRTIGELKFLAGSFDVMMEHIKQLIAETDEVAGKVGDQVVVISDIAKKSNAVSENISVAIEEIAKGATEQLEESQNTFNSLENLADNITETIENVREVELSSEKTREIGNASIVQIKQLDEKSKASTQALDKMQSTFDVVVKEVNNIEKVVTIILAISEQISLLALNASIEAARAGEAGKGFAVVAGEISKLALQTEESTNSITEVIGSIKEYVDSTLLVLLDSKEVFAEQNHMISETISSFEDIVKSTNIINEKIEKVQQLTLEMNTLKEESIYATKNILEITENSSANTEEVASVTIEELEVSQTLEDKAAQLEENVNSLKESLSRFIVEG